MKCKRWVKFILSLFCLLSLFSCSADPDYQLPPAPATLIYMIADNNLDYYAITNIKEMERGLPDDPIGLVFVFIDRAKGTNPSHPYLLQIKQNTDSTIIMSPILKVYPELNSSDPLVLQQVINDVKNYSSKYNAELRRLVLWSHGTGWLPEGTPFNESDDDVVCFCG